MEAFYETNISVLAGGMQETHSYECLALSSVRIKRKSMNTNEILHQSLFEQLNKE